MCGACPGGHGVSPTTAALNRSGRKRHLFGALKRGLAAGATLQLVGDGWTLRTRTGRLRVFGDVEQLVEALEGVHHGSWAAGDSPRHLVDEALGALG